MTQITRIILLILGLFTTILLHSSNANIKVNDIPLDFKVFSIPLMPGDTAYFENLMAEDVQLMSSNKSFIIKSHSAHHWIAPENSGLEELVIRTKEEELHLNIFIMKSLKDIQDNSPHFTLGNYPKTKYKNLDQYSLPLGMIEVTQENQDSYVSEHLQLKSFLTKQGGTFPKYVLLSPSLLYKLELIIQHLEKEDYRIENLHIMSGYRTPDYNQKIGNGKYSRHVYGDAADIYIDNDRNNAMDDLNKDGKINIEDAKIIAEMVEKIDHDPKYSWLKGGMGVYKGNGVHQGFVHVDTRGFIARW